LHQTAKRERRKVERREKERERKRELKNMSIIIHKFDELQNG